MPSLVSKTLALDFFIGIVSALSQRIMLLATLSSIGYTQSHRVVDRRWWRESECVDRLIMLLELVHSRSINDICLSLHGVVLILLFV